MTTDSKENEITLDELDRVAGGAKNADNPVVAEVLHAFGKAVEAGHKAAVRDNGPLGSVYPGHF
jgi:hypothetical protein